MAAIETRRTLQETRSFDRGSNLTDLFAFLRAERFTGKVEVHYGEGGLTAIIAVGMKRLKEPALDLAANMS